jgi:cytochrome c peroxidase
MKKILFLSLIISGICLSQLSFVKTEESLASGPARNYILNELKNLSKLLKTATDKHPDLKSLKENYVKCREHYKHIEFFVEYYSPRESKYLINGPLVLKHDEENGKILSPRGFQVVEEILYKDKKADLSKLRSEYKMLGIELNKLYEYYKSAEINDGILLEMMQLELYRIASLNMNGYDATISGDGIKESVYCLDGIKEIIKCYDGYKKEKELNELLQKIDLAIIDFKKNSDFNTADRLLLITDNLSALNTAFVNFHNACSIPWRNTKQALTLNKLSFFTQENFNLRYFSIYYDDTLNLDKQARLGKILFNDPLLSGDQKRSCATCHAPDKWFTDGLKVNTSLDGKADLKRNTPTLLNVAFQKAFFHDGRAYQLEQQIADVIGNEKEMHGDLEAIIIKLKKDKEYIRLFVDAFKNTSDTVITSYAVQKAITEYEKTLTSFNSRFDKYLKGDKNEITEREKNGYNVFGGKALCGSCHFFPLFNGTVPPFYMDSEFEILGVPQFPDNKNLDDDPGRMYVTGFKEHQYSFKTPTVRNIEFTSPYMHNGVYKTLEEVIEFYHKGGGEGLGYKVPNQTLPFDSLQLDQKEKEDLVLFLKSLSDETIKKTNVKEK